MAWIRSEEEVDAIIEELLTKGNGKYITQSTLFKKDSEQQIEMLKFVLMRSTSFGEFTRQLIRNEMNRENGMEVRSANNKVNEEPIVKKDVNNWL